MHFYSIPCTVVPETGFPKHSLIKYCALLSVAHGFAVLSKAQCKGKAPMYCNYSLQDLVIICIVWSSR